MPNIDSEYKPLSERNISCFVYGCFSTAANKPHIGFHKFPVKRKRNIVVVKKNGDKCIYDRRQLWIEALNIGREAALAIDGVNVYVCSLHFARDDFYYNQDITGRRYLKEVAIPRRNLPARYTSSLTTKFNVKSLNRIRYRGYFNIHNPDGRKLTIPRRYLGSSSLKEGNGVQSYTKTVWVVRKPNLNKDKSKQGFKDGVVKGSITKPHILEDNSQNETSKGQTEDDEQCTILETENLNSPWFTSELIIKEEPISDSEQELGDQMLQKGLEEDFKEPGGQMMEKGLEADFEVSHGTIINDDEDDNNYEPDKLVIQTEEEDEERLTEVDESESTEFPEMEQAESNGIEPIVALEENEEVGENLSNHYENNEEEDVDYQEENDTQRDDYDVTEVHIEPNEEDSEEYSEEGPCNICGELECEGHPKYDTRENYFVCLVCSDIFPSQKLLAAHSVSHQEMSEEELMVHEERTKSLTCEFCGRVLSTKATLREHIMIHTGEKPHECLLCGKSFRHKANLVVHVNGHAVVSTYKCKKCNKAFTKKMDFESHLKYHVDASGNPLVCKICNAVFKSQRTLYNHAQLHSRKGTVRAKKRNDVPKDPVHVCKTCGKVLSTKATLKEHMMIHSGEKPHICTICGRTIRHKANFVVHVQTHGQGKSYECDMCDEAFMRKSDLTQHKQMSHSKSKLLRCPICSEVFKSPQKFNRHMEIHESVVYMNETEELTGFEPHLLEGLLE